MLELKIMMIFFKPVFLKRFRLKFAKPKKDKCDQCEIYWNSEMKNELKSWSRAIILATVELCQVKGQHKMPPWLALRQKRFF